ncbi:Hypothetical protein CINCED_3A002664 [Cinara cedri]|uniref:Uncharacterized protein n=1 Tax=Cinara cedri TaxID=506608 RepID=A0A5E4M5V4_9HEMI|nr:Hypothetical protein CINCED_3A002664 [Cinara cedri]
MVDELELLTNFHKTYSDAQELALNTIHVIEMPICNFLSDLTSRDCIYLMSNKFEDFSILKQPFTEILLQSYLITDYISCGLSSPSFHSIFIKTLLSDGSKKKLIKKLLQIWDCLFKKLKITDQNVVFVKHLIFSLERVIDKISKSVIDDYIQLICNKFKNQIKYCIQKYDQSILEKEVLFTLSSAYELQNSNKKRDLDIEYTFSNKSKVNFSSSFQQILQKKPNLKSTTCNMLNNKQHDAHDYSEPLVDQNLSKKPKLMSMDVENTILHESNKLVSDRILVKPLEPKLNAFQVLMLSAKKLKSKK